MGIARIRASAIQDFEGDGDVTDGKKALSEADICAKYITPAIEDAGWNDDTQMRREVHFTKGQIRVRGKMVYPLPTSDLG